MVKVNPILFGKGHLQYKGRNIKNQIFEKIGANFQYWAARTHFPRFCKASFQSLFLCNRRQTLLATDRNRGKLQIRRLTDSVQAEGVLCPWERSKALSQLTLKLSWSLGAIEKQQQEKILKMSRLSLVFCGSGSTSVVVAPVASLAFATHVTKWEWAFTSSTPNLLIDCVKHVEASGK